MIEASDINRHSVPSASKIVIKHDRKSHVIAKSQHFLAAKSGFMLSVLPSPINGINFSFFLPLKTILRSSLLYLMHSFWLSRLCTSPALFWGYMINKCHCWSALPVQVSEIKPEAPAFFYWSWQIDSFWSTLHFSHFMCLKRGGFLPAPSAGPAWIPRSLKDLLLNLSCAHVKWELVRFL